MSNEDSLSLTLMTCMTDLFSFFINILFFYHDSANVLITETT